jgi:N-acetylglucosaminyl-diphospho-decaprenol L-rhamnosyltransferase
MPANELAFVVVSYNVRELLIGCLASIYAELNQAPALNAAVWVIDNASSDGSADVVRQQFPAARLLVNIENRGFAAANNQALRAMGFEAGAPATDEQPRFVAFLNPDTTLETGALRRWLAVAEEHPEAGVIGAGLRYPDGRFQHSAFAFPTLWQILLDFSPLHHRLLGSRLNGRYPRRLYAAGRPFAVDHPLGAAMLARREAIATVGLFDEGYFIYAEEVDWCMRLKAAGWQALCAPAVTVVHHEAQSTRQFKEAMFVALWKSRLRLFAKHYSPAFNWAARRLVQLGLGRLRRQARALAAAGQLDAAALGRRLAAFEQVANLLRQPPAAFLA